MILALGYVDREDYIKAVKEYRNAHFEDGWQEDGDDMTVLFNPKTGEYCKLYVASDKDFEVDDDCDDLDPLKGLLQFCYPVSYEADRKYLDEQFKDIKYHRVISRSFEHMVRLGKKKLYYSDAGCCVLTANPADVIEFQEVR